MDQSYRDVLAQYRPEACFWSLTEGRAEGIL